MTNKRYDLLDTIRGIVLVSMVIYHASWNMVYIYGVNWDWYKSPSAYVWQQSICWTFILLSGFCFSLGKRHIKSGLMVFGSGLLVTIATLCFMPQNRVVFGVLTCIGSCILFLHVTQKLWIRIPAGIGLVIAFFLFLFSKNVNDGYLGLGRWRWLVIPEEWYGNYVSAFLGFPYKGFYSTDYFSLIPWVFLFLTGFYLYRLFEQHCIMEKDFMHKKLPLFTFLGRKSLLIYLLHQPIIYGLQEMIF